MRWNLAIATGLMQLLSAAAFGQLQLVPMKFSKVKLVNGKNSVVVDLDEALSGTNRTMPGEAPHKYKVLFRTQKGGFLYLVANVQSRSPISDPMAPCGGDAPQSILWIKANRTLKKREFDSQIYASCSYNYYDSKVNITKSSVTINYGGSNRKQLYYRNREPQKGLVLGEFLAMPQIN